MRRAVPTICLLLLFLLAGGWQADSAFGGLAEMVHTGRSNPIVSTGGSSSAGGSLQGTVEGIAPPVISDDTAGATVTIRLNGWIDEQPQLRWDEIEQVWVFKYDIPAGMKDAVITITVTDATTGSTTTQTIIAT